MIKSTLLSKLLCSMLIFLNLIICFGFQAHAENGVPIPDAHTNKPSEYITDRFIVKYKDNQGRSDINKALKDKLVNVEIIKSKRNIDVITTNVKIKSDELFLEIKNSRLDDHIEYIQPDYKVELESDDTYYYDQWSLDNQSVASAVYGVQPTDLLWEQSQGEGIVVGIIDTGIDIYHNDLNENIFLNKEEIAGNGIDDDSNGYTDDVNGWDFVGDTNQVYNQQISNEGQHGTHIAGIIAGKKDNGVGIAGLAPKAKILPLKVFSGGQAYTSDIIEAIEYAVNMGVRIINCSWGTIYENLALKETMEDAGANILFVCAAGNSGVNIDANPIYPAAYKNDNIITVAAINKTGDLSSASNYGEISVDIAAPGVDIISTLPDNSYGIRSGTSMAAAYISGAAALLRSKFPDVEISELKERILDLTDKLPTLLGKVYKGNKINVSNAIFGIRNDEIISDETSTVIEDVYGSTPSVTEDVYGIPKYTMFDEGAFYSLQSASASMFSVPSEGVNGQFQATIYGKTYSNLLGDKGKGDSINGIAVDGVLSTDGEYITITRNNSVAFQNFLISVNGLDINKYYFVKSYIESTNGAVAFVTMYPNNGWVNGTSITEKGWSYAKCKPSDCNNSTSFYGIGGILLGTSGDSAKFKHLLLVEISEDEYNNLSLEELSEKYPYIDGTQSVAPIRIKSFSRNMVQNGNCEEGTLHWNNANSGPCMLSTENGRFKVVCTSSNSFPYQAIPVKPNTMYYLKYNTSSPSNVGLVVFSPKFDAVLKYGGENAFNSGNNNFVMVTMWTLPGTWYFDSIQMVEGLVEPALYESYQESITYIGNNIVLNRLPNGITDEVNISQGQYMQKIKKIPIDSNNELSYYNNTLFSTISYAATSTEWVNLHDAESTTDNIICSNNDINFTPMISFLDNGQPQVAIGSGRLWIAIPKEKIGGSSGYSDDLAGFIKYLRDEDTTLIYQLAQPQIQKVNIPPIICYPGGTIIIDNAVKGIALYNRGIGISDRSLPIESIESIHRIQGSTYIPVDLSKATIAADGLSFTISDAQQGDKYEYVYTYESCLSTTPTITFSVPANTQAQINDSLNMIKQQSDMISSHEERLKYLENQSGRINVGPFKINCTIGINFTLALTASNSKDFSNRYFTVIYNPLELDVADLCGETTTLETGVCNVDGTNIVITRADPGVIEFFIYNPVISGSSFSGAVNTIVFRPKMTGQATLSYTTQ